MLTNLPYLGNQQSVLDMTGEALHVNFPIVSLPTNNMNQKNIRYTLHRKFVSTKILFYIYFRLDATLPFVKRLIFLYHCNFAEI